MDKKEITTLIQKLFTDLSFCNEFDDYSSLDLMDFKKLWKEFDIDTTEYEENQ